MTLHYGMAVQRNADETGTTPVDDRKNIEGMFVRAGAIRRGTDALVAGSAGWTFTLNAAWFVTQRATGDGFQLWGNDGAITLSANAAGTALPASAPAAGLSRYYRVWVRHRANEAGLDSTSVPDAGVEFSAASSSPTLPALPTGATEVATNLMTSAATSTASAGNTLVITMPWTAARGGVVHCRTQAELDTLVAASASSAPILAELGGVLSLCTGAASSTGTAVTYGSGWGAYGGAYQEPTWWRDAEGFVHLQGLVKRTGATITAGASGTILTLPAGARPAGDLIVPLLNGEDSGAMARFNLSSAGVLAAYANGTWASGAAWVSLSGLTFRAAV